MPIVERTIQTRIATKLTPAQVRRIRELHAGGASLREIRAAVAPNVSVQTVHNVVRGKSWVGV